MFVGEFLISILLNFSLAVKLFVYYFTRFAVTFESHSLKKIVPFKLRIPFCVQNCYLWTLAQRCWIKSNCILNIIHRTMLFLIKVNDTVHPVELVEHCKASVPFLKNESKKMKMNESQTVRNVRKLLLEMLWDKMMFTTNSLKTLCVLVAHGSTEVTRALSGKVQRLFTLALSS